MPTYRQLAQKYNQRLERLDRLQAALTVVFTWQDDRGKHTEQGNGKLAVQWPDRLRLLVTHIAQRGPIISAGSNDTYYWLFDFRDQHTLYLGRHDRFDKSHRDRLDVPAHPRLLPHLLGIVPLPKEPTDKPTQVAWTDNCFHVAPPGTSTRLWITPDSYLPVRIEVLDEKAQPTAVALLSRPAAVELVGRAPDGRTKVATRIEITRPGGEDQLRLTLAPESLHNKTFNENWFDLDLLKNKLYKITPEHTVDLDKLED